MRRQGWPWAVASLCLLLMALGTQSSHSQELTAAKVRWWWRRGGRQMSVVHDSDGASTVAEGPIYRTYIYQATWF